ncbi:hypothetical protein ACN4EK_26410 [Pantanalinema rosaneae CENA516]|uniref:hypothetical protein n=1 Tax=Pantanalinema rosaneae TaxID=1620701 RepID=UPI003D6EA1DD
MGQRHVVNQVAAAVTVTLITLGTIANLAAAIALKDGDKVNGLIRSNSPSFQFRNWSRTGSPAQTARGEEYTFTAQRGDNIEISVDAEDGSSLKPILVLLSPTGKQVAYDETRSLLQYRVPTAGLYKLLVLGNSNTLGRYNLAIDGLSSATAATPGTPTSATSVAPADQVMQDVLKLRVIGCGVPNVARIKIGTEERCTRDIEAGQYSYDDTSKRITLIDTRRELLAQRLQINLLDRCPSNPLSVIQVTMTDPQDSKDYTYCANPTRFLKAGTYRYNVTTDELQPATTAQTPTPTPPSTPTANSSTPDARRQLLQTEYGLTVLDSCPANRGNIVQVSFPEGTQTYEYCANPNRLVKAGKYVYNTQTASLEPDRKPANCTVAIGGLCILK